MRISRRSMHIFQVIHNHVWIIIRVSFFLHGNSFWFIFTFNEHALHIDTLLFINLIFTDSSTKKLLTSHRFNFVTSLTYHQLYNFSFHCFFTFASRRSVVCCLSVSWFNLHNLKKQSQMLVEFLPWMCLRKRINVFFLQCTAVHT